MFGKGDSLRNLACYHYCSLCMSLPTISARGKAIHDVYRKWGVPEQFLHGNLMTASELLRLLGAIQNRIPEMNARVMPSSFDPDDSALCAFPSRKTAGWNSCERVLRDSGARGVMMRLPLFWQVEPNLFAACQAAGAFIFINDADNMPLGTAAVRDAHIDTIVTDAGNAHAFARYLLEKKSGMAKTWIIVHAPHTDIAPVPKALEDLHIRVAQEVHVFPGVPVLVQCTLLEKNKESSFHVSDSYEHEKTKDGLALTSTDASPLPFFRYELPLRLRDEGQCGCGKTIFAATH